MLKYCLFSYVEQFIICINFAIILGVQINHLDVKTIIKFIVITLTKFPEFNLGTLSS